MHGISPYSLEYIWPEPIEDRKSVTLNETGDGYHWQARYLEELVAEGEAGSIGEGLAAADAAILERRTPEPWDHLRRKRRRPRRR